MPRVSGKTPSVSRATIRRLAQVAPRAGSPQPYADAYRVAGKSMVIETSAEMQRAPQCREHQILYGRLRADTKVYVNVTRRLESCKQEDFEKTYEAAQSARLAFLNARKRLALHVVEHKCER